MGRTKWVSLERFHHFFGAAFFIEFREATRPTRSLASPRTATLPKPMPSKSSACAKRRPTTPCWQPCLRKPRHAVRRKWSGPEALGGSLRIALPGVGEIGDHGAVRLVRFSAAVVGQASR